MAANKLTVMVYKSTSKITRILIYAVLEWTLIFLLLLNSLFSYLIVKFSEHFGLNPPCVWCSRVDHIFEPGKQKNYHRDLLCKAHRVEVSELGFCSNHQRLTESKDMCQDCLSSTAQFQALTKNFAFRKEVGMVNCDGVAEVRKEEVILNCCCCDESLESSKYFEYNLIKSSSWDTFELSDKKILAKDVEDDDNLEDDMKTHIIGQYFVSDQCGNKFSSVYKNEESVVSVVDSGLGVEENVKTEDEFLADYVPKHREIELQRGSEVIVEEIQGSAMKDQSVQVSIADDAFNEFLGQHLEFFFDGSGHKLVPFELIDSPKMEDLDRHRSTDLCQENVDSQEAHLEFAVNLTIEDKLGAEMESESAFWPRDEDKSKNDVLESMEMEENEKSSVFHAREFPSLKELLDQIAITQSAQEFKPMAASEDDEKHSALEDIPEVAGNETDAEVSIGTEIPDLDAADDIHPEYFEENPSTSAKKDEEHSVELRSFSVEFTDYEEDKVPDTPTSVDSTQNISKKSFFQEKKDSGAEDSFEGSFISELECDEDISTVERLKSALRSEQKTLQALYAELEEERSASAVAANQTMAMINRLQEEKAQMQMEALQYQRMMEEQSEYDQEALQLLNELMVKREKEKQQIEKELEIYRRKVVDYETKEKLRILRKSKDGSHRFGFSSASCSNGEDSDALSIDLNQEVKEEDGFYGNEEYCNGHSPDDAIVNLEDSLNDFEDERLSILEQLKVLEVKLMNLDGEDNPNFDDISPLEQLLEENGYHKLEERKIIGVEGKSLLPLFDAVKDENGDSEHDEIQNGFNNSNGVLHENLIIENSCIVDNKKIDVEEQVDNLHERLQALEADREFLKHCMSSLRKGDKGVHLLQEILQHLRDLKNVELRLRNSDDDVVLSC